MNWKLLGIFEYIQPQHCCLMAILHKEGRGGETNEGYKQKEKSAENR